MIAGLDGLRAIAFLLVLLFHTRYLAFGWLGVQLFFVLSGFLISDILLRMKEKLPRRDFFVKFYGRRFLRIFPLYYFYLLLVTLLIFQLPQLGLNALKLELGRQYLNQVAVSVFYLFDFFHASSFFVRSRFFTHLWSLSVEEQFYLLWPLLIALTPREKFKQLCLTSIALGPILRLAISFAYRARLSAWMLNDPQLAVNVLPFSQIDAFAFGAYIARFDLPRPRLQLLTLVILAPTIGVLTDFLSKGSLSASLGYDLPMTGLYKEVWAYSLLNYLFAVLIYCVARTSFLTSMLHSAPLRYLGRISYGLYVYHYGILAICVALMRKYDLPYRDHSPQVLLLTFAATTFVASLSFYLMEKPLINLKEKYFRVDS